MVTQGSALNSAGGRAADEAAIWHTWAALGVGIAALALLIYFDLQTNLVIIDEYARRWMIERLAGGHGLARWGQNSGLVQVFAALPLALLHLEPRFYRLSLIPFLVLEAFITWKFARRLGADQFWSAVAAILLVSAPLTLSVATGIMNESVFLGLLMAAAWFAADWVEQRRNQWLCLAMLVLATVQREQAAAIVPAIGLAIILARAKRRPTWIDLAWLAAAAVLVTLAVELPHLLPSVGGLGYPTRPIGSSALSAYGVLSGVLVHLAYPVFDLVNLPIVLGLLFIPLCLGLLARLPVEGRRLGRAEMLPVALATFGLLGAAKLLVFFQAPMFPGPNFGTWGLGPTTLPNPKANLFPDWLFGVIELLTIATFVVMLIWRRRAWTPVNLGPVGVLLVFISLSQFLPLFVYDQTLDRYFLAVAAPLVPLTCAWISRAPRLPRGAKEFALASLVAGLLVYVAGQQDYTAWLVARDQAAQIAYQRYPPSQVVAGTEASEEYIWVPAANDPAGNLPKSVSDYPNAVLLFAGQDDPRPGVAYHSLASGKIVIIYRAPTYLHCDPYCR